MDTSIITAAEAREITLKETLNTIGSHIKNAAANNSFIIMYTIMSEQLPFYKEISDVLIANGYQVSLIPHPFVLGIYNLTIKW